eukprot:TRINITY_DN4336_c0_g1_i3.p1 TRINITY_DN4336_c0_g1~~TRINITY_DN4336_c0_g1_i3.p1  ORF type:complete len:310 (+),score=79.01 TRINITY_DN4336_c0_g1_i3:147-1076(+)
MIFKELIAIRDQLVEMVKLTEEIKDLKEPKNDMFDSDDSFSEENSDVETSETQSFFTSNSPIKKENFIKFTSGGVQTPDIAPMSTHAKLPSWLTLVPPSEQSSTTKNVVPDDGIGQWEQFTKGIGSKILSKFGYIRGTGLGKGKTGIPEPIPIDKQSGNNKLGLGHDKRDKLKPKIPRSTTKRGKKRKRSEGDKKNTLDEDDEAVFDLINHRVNQPEKKKQKTNYKGLTTEEMQKLLKEKQTKSEDLKKYMLKLEMSIERNKKKDKTVAEQTKLKLKKVKEDIGKIDEELNQLKTRLELKEDRQNSVTF